MMGTHGRRGLKGLLLGSVAKEVAHRSPVPVVTTRAEADGASPPQRILVACDFSEHSLQSLCLAAVWARHLSAEVTLLHVVESFVYPEFYFDHALEEENLERSIQRSHDYLARIAKDHLSGVVHETVVIHAPVAEGIAEYASINDFDLVVLATRGLSGVAGVLFGSVAESHPAIGNPGSHGSGKNSDSDRGVGQEIKIAHRARDLQRLKTGPNKT